MIAHNNNQIIYPKKLVLLMKLLMITMNNIWRKLEQKGMKLI